MKYLLFAPNLLASLFKRAFSPVVEDSLRLRIIGIASLWLGALGIIWAGGSLWIILGGAALGTAGYLVSWYRRHHRSRVWPLFIAAAIVATALVMRSQVLDVFAGNWLPLGQFLVLVQALASFDVRTRGGLYTALIMSGIVLFFGSQQAFNETFGVFVIGFVVLLLAFLSVSFIEDGVRSARIYWRKHQASTVIFWIAATCGVFVLSGLAFWVMPRGETSLGLPQIAILPLSANSLEGAYEVPDFDPATIPVSLDRRGAETMPSFNEGVSSIAPLGQGGSSTRGPVSVGAREIPRDAFLGYAEGVGQDHEVVFFVRSKVASYWKGRTLDTFDGVYWRTSDAASDLARSRYTQQLWVNRESFGLDNRLRYGQTFFIQQDLPETLFTGYRGVRIIAEEDSLQGLGVEEGDSYRVLSAHPRHSVERLRLSRVGWVGSKYLTLPPDSQRLGELSRRITEGTTSDFAKLERILGYLALRGRYDQRRPGDLTSSASLNEFLFEREPGSALDYATATVMLARASGLPSRLATGYLPGGSRSPFRGLHGAGQGCPRLGRGVF